MKAQVRAGHRLRCPRCAARFDPAAVTDPTEFAFSDLVAAEKAGVAVPRAAPDEGELRLAPPAGEPPREPSPYSGLPPSGPKRKCPGCRTEYPPGTRICVPCGMEIRTGRLLRMEADDHLNDAYVVAEQVIRVLSWIFWFGVYPFATEAFGTRKPWVIRGVAVVTTFVSLLALWSWVADTPLGATFNGWVLWAPGAAESLGEDIVQIEQVLADEELTDPEMRSLLADELELLRRLQSDSTFHPLQLISHALLHADLLHLAGNMLFLMVLGSAVNRLIGNVLTLILYPLFGIAAGLVQLAFVPEGALLGASGAIAGLSGMYLVLFPLHRVHVAAWMRWGLIRFFHLSLSTFTVPGFVVVLFYASFDVLYTVLGVDTGVAHWAHLGGLGAGVAAAFLLLVTRMVNSRGGDLFSVMLGRHAWALIGGPRKAA